MKDVAIITDSTNFNKVDDDLNLKSELEDLGIGADICVWNDDKVDWSQYRSVIVRSAWDYTNNYDDFLAWTKSVDETSLLLNAAEVIKWNADKNYLSEINCSGINIVPTSFITKGSKPELPEADDYVIKPAVSNSGKNSGRFSAQDETEALALLVHILLTGDAIVQPYIPEIDIHGEKALIFVGGQFSHAVTKGPVLLPGGKRSEIASTDKNIEPSVASEEEINFAYKIFEVLPFGHELAYARVDVVRSQDELMLMELELIEPYLYFNHSDNAAELLANHIYQRLG